MEFDKFVNNQSATNQQEIFVINRKDWVPYNVTPDSSLFPIFQKVIHQVDSGKEVITIAAINKERSLVLKKEIKDQFRFIFNWQNENICEVSVFKKSGDCE